PEVGRLPAVAGEACVERPVRAVAGEREVAEAAQAQADRDDLAVALERHPPRPVGGAEDEVGRLPAVPGEARVERAVGVVAGEREVPAGRALTDCDDLAVALECHASRKVDAAEVGRLLAIAGEARIERAVRVVAGEREVVASREAGRDDLAVALDRYPGRPIEASEVGGLPAVPGEARVERPVGVVAGEPEVAANFAYCDDLAVALERYPKCLVVEGPEGGRLPAVAGEARVE